MHIDHYKVYMNDWVNNINITIDIIVINLYSMGNLSQLLMRLQGFILALL